MDKKYLNTVGVFECEVQAPGSDPAGKSFGWLALSKQKGTPSVRIPLIVISGEHRGEITVHNLWLTEDTEDATTTRLAECFGFDGDYKALHHSKGFAGMKCQIETEAETYMNKPRLKVKWLNPAGGGAGKAVAMDAAKVDSIFAKINVAKHKAVAKQVNTALAASKPKAAATTAAAPVEGDGPPESDDVPF